MELGVMNCFDGAGGGFSPLSRAVQDPARNIGGEDYGLLRIGDKSELLARPYDCVLRICAGSARNFSMTRRAAFAAGPGKIPSHGKTPPISRNTR